MLSVVSVAARFLASLQHHQYLAFLAVHLLDALLQHLNGLLERHHLGTGLRSPAKSAARTADVENDHPVSSNMAGWKMDHL